MQVLDTVEIAKLLAKSLGRPILLLSFPDFCDAKYDYFEHVFLAAPYLANNEEAFQGIADGHILIVCDSHEEMQSLYNQTVGDDGPTDTNKYDGPCKIYALTINKNGEPLTENT